jgi:hypothetical protein
MLDLVFWFSKPITLGTRSGGKRLRYFGKKMKPAYDSCVTSCFIGFWEGSPHGLECGRQLGVVFRSNLP